MSSLSKVNLHLVEDYDDVTACLDWLSSTNTDRLGFDVESTGIDVETDAVRLVQFGDRHHGWAIPIDRWWGLIAEIITRWSRRGRFVGHNARFDVDMMAKHGLHVPVHLVDDTRFIAHIHNPIHSTALKSQTARHVDERAAAMQRQLDEVMTAGGWTWATIPITAHGPCAVYWHYAALDPVLTVLLWDRLAPPVVRQAPRAYDIELSTGWLASRMERRGAAVDRPYTLDRSEAFAADFRAFSARGREQFGVELSSPSQIIARLLGDEVPLWKRSAKTGMYSLDKQALAGIGHPLIRLYQDYKHIEKLSSTYLRRFLEYSERDGRLHPRINTIGGSNKSEAESGGDFGVKTARMSMDRPNLQQLPRVNAADAYASAIRGCIVAAPGHTLVMCDFDQIEMRIMAHLTRDPGLIEAFLADGDFFTLLAQQVYSDDSIGKGDPRRTLTKSYAYATNYGAGNDKLATTTGVPLADIERLSADFRASYPGVAEFQRAVQRTAAARYRDEGTAYVRSPLTNRRFIAEDSDKLYPLVNFLIQGMAAEIMKTKALELDAAGIGDYMILFVHDEVIAEVPDDDVADAVDVFRSVMNDSELLSVPLTAGVAAGKRWNEKVDVI